MKVSGSFESLLRGVSEQAPNNRLPGQCTEQVNLIPDPVHGLTRRHGSTFLAEATIDDYLPTFEADLRAYRSFSYEHNGESYDLLIRTKARPPGGPTYAYPVIVYKRSTAEFLPVEVGWDTAWSTGGVSAVTAIGKYVVFAGNTVTPGATSVDKWGDSANQALSALWIRGGAYARTFTVRATKTDNTVVTFSYTTPQSSYQGLLDTSAVPVFVADPAGGTTSDTESAYVEPTLYTAELTWYAWSPTGLTAKKGATAMTNVHPAAPANSLQFSWAAGAQYVQFHSSNAGASDISLTYTHTKTSPNPNYARVVGQLTNEYNSAVTSWIGTAAEAIQPASIAEALKDAAVAAGLGASRVDSTVVFSNVKELDAKDGGDGSLVRGVDSEVSSIDQVSTVHWVGKIVKVRPSNSQDGFYLKAEPTTAGSTGWAAVRWVEAAGTEHSITSGLALGFVDGGSFRLSSDLVGEVTTGAWAGRPYWVLSTAGDGETSPLPFFVGKKITYLGMFQDRLLIGAGGVVRASRIGDYFNLFRTSLLTVTAEDPFEVSSLGNEDDTLRHGVLYDRDLVLFGEKRQYAISGRVPLSATNANMPVMSSHLGAADTPPVESGGLIFYAKHGAKSTAAYQIEPGRNVESPQAFPISAHLDTYIRGKAVEMLALARPSALVLRTDTAPNDLFLFSYLDSPDGRQQGAWYRFNYSTVLGPIIGISGSDVVDGFIIFFLRARINSSGVTEYGVVADFQSMVPSLSQQPYLDSQRPWPTATKLTSNAGSEWCAAFDDSSELHNVGTPLSNVANLIAQWPTTPGLRAGALQTATWVPTNPTPRDGRGQAILTGRCTVSKLVLAVQDCGGLVSDVTDQEPYVFNGRIVGTPGNLVGRAPRSTGTISLPVGRERLEYTQTITSRDWQPMAITSVNWVGQLFNRSPRL